MEVLFNMLFSDASFGFWMISTKNVMTKVNARLSYPYSVSTFWLNKNIEVALGDLQSLVAPNGV